jgi:hypothetical protein
VSHRRVRLGFRGVDDRLENRPARRRPCYDAPRRRPEDAVPRFHLALLHAAISIGLLGVFACGDEDGKTDGVGSSSPDDGAEEDAAPPEPDAAACAMTMCGDQCVDTATDPAHCGGCDMACDSPGQICSGALPCACPPEWIPADLTGLEQSQVNTSLFPGLLVGIAPVFDDERASAVLVGFVEDTPVDTDIDLATITAPDPPLVAAGFDLDVATNDVKTPYLATSGTVNFTELCAEGVRGTVTDALFVEIAGITEPTPIEGGCQIAVPSLEFDIGQPCGTMRKGSKPRGEPPRRQEREGNFGSALGSSQH